MYVLIRVSMFFHLQYIHLFRPFLKYAPSTSPLPGHVSPRRICTANAGAISKLMRLYKKSWNLRQICNIAVYMIHSACTIHLLNLPEKEREGGARSTARVELARKLMDRGRMDHAEKILRQSIEKEPVPEAYLQLANILLQRKKPEDALRFLKQGKKEFPDAFRLDVGVAKALLILDQVEEAKDLVTKAMLRDPFSWEAHLVLGEIHEKLDDKALAIREYKKAITLLKKLLREKK